MIDTLNNLQPVMIFFLLALFFTLETFIPYLTEYQDRKRHTIRNLMLVLLAFAANGAAASWFGYWIPVIREHGWGLLNIVRLPSWASAIAGVLLIDLDSYVGHIAFHRIPWLWSIHRVHHSDIEMDSTSSLRFHPFEPLVQSLWRTVSFTLIGVSFSSFVLFFTFLLPFLFIQHANIRVPEWMERSIGAIFVMSGWHRVHHSDEQRHTDSHYANLLTFWDRLFGTAHRNVAPGEISVGLKEFQADATQTVWNQLMLPFRRPQAE